MKIIPKGEFIFLEGPKPRTFELIFAWKVWKEFIKGFRALHFVGPAITVFGGARFKREDEYYKTGLEIGKRIALSGFATVTGGGPGLMEAVNKGAFENGGKSIGINILLPFEQYANPYLHKSVTIDYFFVRKTLLLKYSYAFIVLPGGFGTMDELYETITLMQTNVVHDFPVVLIGKAYWKKMFEFIDEMVAYKTISPQDPGLIKVTDSLDEAMEYIKAHIDTHFRVAQRHKPIWWLFERS
ncbi:MAG TPA: TIGR00730 family Rossman fold protein [Saprospiraceae bacterium]|nr:TIGR00730 family Rossman fold protein [Saprospiraceae bacterium]HNT21968.1 TIGR00730 family Rossman fold protein [Saprospiraceae bacterium]